MSRGNVYDLGDFVDEPGHRLEMALGDAGLDSVEEHAVVGLRQLDAREQVRDDTLEQRHVLSMYECQVSISINCAVSVWQVDARAAHSRAAAARHRETGPR